MEGLGPNNSSLLERTGHKFEMTSDWLEMDRQERSMVRKASAIKYAMKHKKPAKPIAPVEQMNGVLDMETRSRLWRWVGENNGLKKDGLYTAVEIRRYGFKLPKLKKKGK